MAIVASDGCENVIRDIFKAIDTDDNQRIGLEELHRAIALISPNVTAGQVREVFREVERAMMPSTEMDSVDYLEFGEFLRTHPLFLHLFHILYMRGELGKLRAVRPISPGP
jgi:hypothetical protein